jgi:tetratricopeptide (TPR) repeat protein
MRNRRTLLAGAAALVAAATVLLGGVLADDPAAQRAAPAGATEAQGQLLQGFSPGDTAALVERLVARVDGAPRDAQGLTLLGLAYQQRARETADPTFYTRAEAALRRARALHADDPLTLTGLAALAASRHRFAEARHLASRVVELNPASAEAHGILGDALVELGRYGAAFAAFDRMAALKPSLAAYARVAYARELVGRPRDAVAAMELAVRAGSVGGENTAWAFVELGNLHFNGGRLRPAERAYRGALARLPGYHRAQAGLARVRAAERRFAEAAALYRRAVDAVPLPEYAVGLGDTLTAAGRSDDARKAYALVDAVQRLFAANGVRTDLETALLDVDRGLRLGDALARAREAYGERKSIEAEDVLAWALYANGRCEEARRHSVAALRLGTLDALKLFHRGMIERCLGHGAESRAFLDRALDVNPYFSLRYAPVANEVLR